MSQDYIAGQRLGDYEVLGVLGAGGMGKVYKVRNVISDRVEAMKILCRIWPLKKSWPTAFSAKSNCLQRCTIRTSPRYAPH